MSDIVARLRALPKGNFILDGGLIHEAADLIEALTAERDELVLTLQLIAHATAPTPNDGGGHENAYTLAMDRLDARKEQT